jgi:hypothetical protein
MTAAVCTPLSAPSPVGEREQPPDRFGELLECMADLLVETRKQRANLPHHGGSEDPRVRKAIARLSELELSLEEVAVEAATVHQLLEHVHLV